MTLYHIKMTINMSVNDNYFFIHSYEYISFANYHILEYLGHHS